MVRLPGWSCQIKSSAGCPVESALRKNKECFSRSLPCAVFDVLFLCVFICRFFAKSGTLPKQGGGREGAGSGRAERRGEAEPGGPGGPAGLSAHRSRRRSWGRRQPRLRCPGQGQGPRGRGPGQPQARGCHGRSGAPVCPSSSPGVPHQSPARAELSARAGEPRRPLAGRDRSCPGAAAPEPATGQARKRPISLASSFSFGWFL